MRYSVIIIGSGASGIAAATRLLQGGVNDFVILEAENRIGGRIHSIPFDGATADLGAQWVHGEEDNCVYALAEPTGLVTLDPLMANWAGAEFRTQRGTRLPEETQVLLYSWLTGIELEGQTKLKNFKGSLGEYFTKEFKARLDNYKKPIDKELAMSFLAWYEQFEDSIDASDTWFETSGNGHLAYVDCEGNLLNMWKSGGYHSILNILLSQLQNQDEFHSRVRLGREVTDLEWGHTGVKVTCKDGSKFEADRVLVTVSLGVLKERAKTMFKPSLPDFKLNAIQGLAIGTVDKIILRFSENWWPEEDFSGFCMLWTATDHELPPHQGWLRYVFGFFPMTGLPNCLCGWVVGAPARHMEQLADSEVVQGCVALLRKFLSQSYNVPEPVEMKRSQWYTNPHFRGSYSYRSLESDRLKTDASQLAAPICDPAGKPVLMFAGEASHDKYFSTVHGAVESGWREADRILAISTGAVEGPMERHRVVIVGAGLAGLGAAKTLAVAGITDIVVLEAQERAGGRAWTESWGDGGEIVESGAQWIHGQHGNPIYQLASENGLVLDLKSAEGLGPYIREDGEVFPSSLVSEVSSRVQEILDRCEEFAQEPGTDAPHSVGSYLREQFLGQLAADPNLTEQDRQKRVQLFDWHLRYQVIDNSCLAMEEVSAQRWGDYATYAGRDYTSIKGGYSALVDLLVSQLPQGSVRLQSPVSTVQYRTNLEVNSLCPASRNRLGISSPVPWEPPVLVTCKDGTRFGAESVIVTCSLGVLKAVHRSMFLPALPPYLIQPILDLGFGGITKIYLDYEEPWWTAEEKGFQLLWSSAPRPTDESVDSWTRDLSGFDVLPTQGNVLLGWVGGEGARQVEEIPEEDVAKHCTNLLQNFLGRPVAAPRKIFRTRWHSNKHVRGAYSHTRSICDETGSRPEHLLQPVWGTCPTPRLQLPVVQLAGEAGHPSHFSTTHGAYETGVSQAQRIIAAPFSPSRAKY